MSCRHALNKHKSQANGSDAFPELVSTSRDCSHDVVLPASYSSETEHPGVPEFLVKGLVCVASLAWFAHRCSCEPGPAKFGPRAMGYPAFWAIGSTSCPELGTQAAHRCGGDQALLRYCWMLLIEVSGVYPSRASLDPIDQAVCSSDPIRCLGHQPFAAPRTPPRAGRMDAAASARSTLVGLGTDRPSSRSAQSAAR